MAAGDILYWYESPKKRILWKSRVREVHQFAYESKNQVAERIVSLFGPFDEEQAYFVNAPSEGYCVAGNVDPLEYVNIPRPDDFQFRRTGWVKVEDIAERWPELRT